jgi:two-component system, cell cycle sensor histidine kinase and response regulator CckA
MPPDETGTVSTTSIPDREQPSPAGQRLPRNYLAVLLSCAVLAVLGLTFQVRHEYNRTLGDWREKLSGIADGEATYVTAWLHERMGDTEIVSARARVISVLSPGMGQEARDRTSALMQPQLDQTARLYGYSAIYILDSQANIRASTANAPSLPASIVEPLKSVSEMTVRVLPDAIADRLGARVGFASPVRSGGRVLGVALLLTPADHIYALPFQESGTTRTGESMVLREEGGKVVVFGSLRNAADLSAEQYRSLEPGVLATRTVLERHAASGEDDDYRHVRTLVETRSIPEVGWGVITKIDREEALQSFYPQATLEVAIGLVIVLALVAVSIAAWRHQQVGLLEAEIVRRKQVEHDLRQAEELFSKAFRSSPEGFSISTLHEGRYIEANDAYLSMMGYERSEVIGRTASELQVWENPAERSTLVARLLTHDLVSQEKASFRTKLGEIREIRLSADVIQLRGQPCILTLARDVTEQILLEEQLRQAQKMEAMGRLAGGVAHDFNNLLGVIMGYSELLGRELGADSPLHRRVEAISTAGERAASLTAQLLAFSRKQVLQPKVVNLNSIVSETDKMLRRLIGEDVEATTVLDSKLGQVKADPGQIVQVIMNLSVNARDAMPKGGKLVIETANVTLPEGTVFRGASVPPGPYVMLAVRDTGSGMTSETQARIFEPFFTTKPAGKGTGLGLATVCGIVEQSGGHVYVDSAMGKGKTFKIYLPRVDEVAEAAPSQKGSAELRGSETILLVEDDPSLRDLIYESLQTGGYTVLLAVNGVDALQVLKRHQGHIDLLMTDVIMPQMSGPELVQRVTTLRPEIKVLYMSGYTDDQFGSAPAQGPGTALIQKPFQLDELARKMREVLTARIETGGAGSGMPEAGLPPQPEREQSEDRRGRYDFLRTRSS